MSERRCELLAVGVGQPLEHDGEWTGATRANGQPAFGCYLPEVGGYGLVVLAVTGDLVSAMTWFGDRSLFPHFGLPSTPMGVDLE